MNAQIDVPAGGAWFEGHFPGRPILPGVAELALILDALANGTPPALQGIAFARLRRLVLPGERLELAARELDASRLRFELKRQGSLVANGELVLGPPPVPPAAAGISAPAAAEAGLPAPDLLLPHRPPMRFLSSILQQTGDGLTAAGNVPDKCALVAGGSAPALVTIEAAAQAAAAWEALRRWNDGGRAEPRVGYLVAMQDVEFFVGRLPADRLFTVSVRLDALTLPLSRYRFEAALEGRLLARGAISTFLDMQDQQQTVANS
jgi:3-hydroxyacyl-[acyl-carrier-protein] dehydratase